MKSKILFGTKRICDYLGISRNTFFRLVKEEKLPVVKRIGGWRANADILDEYLTQDILSEVFSDRMSSPK